MHERISLTRRLWYVPRKYDATRWTPVLFRKRTPTLDESGWNTGPRRTPLPLSESSSARVPILKNVRFGLGIEQLVLFVVVVAFIGAPGGVHLIHLLLNLGQVRGRRRHVEVAPGRRLVLVPVLVCIPVLALALVLIRIARGFLTHAKPRRRAGGRVNDCTRQGDVIERRGDPAPAAGARVPARLPLGEPQTRRRVRRQSRGRPRRSRGCCFSGGA